jgi:EAL domain-containing protein (putative c-di-GMP-specific phosphodiesterase class I)
MRGDGNVIFYPKEFIPVAEAMGLIHQIDFWVVAKVFELIVNMPETYRLLSIFQAMYFWMRIYTS